MHNVRPLVGPQSAPALFLLVETPPTLPRVLPSRASPLQSARLILLKQNSLTAMLQALNAFHRLSESRPHGRLRFRPFGSDPHCQHNLFPGFPFSCALCQGHPSGLPFSKDALCFPSLGSPCREGACPPVCPGPTHPASALLSNL